MSAKHQAVGQVRVPVGAQAVGGEERAPAVAVEGVGLPAVVETDAADLPRSAVVADFDPALRIRPGGRRRGCASTARLRGGGNGRLTW